MPTSSSYFEQSNLLDIARTSATNAQNAANTATSTLVSITSQAAAAAASSASAITSASAAAASAQAAATSATQNVLTNIPNASTSTRGLAKVDGSTILVALDGTLSVNVSALNIPPVVTPTVVRVDNTTILKANDGTLSVNIAALNIPTSSGGTNTTAKVDGTTITKASDGTLSVVGVAIHDLPTLSSPTGSETLAVDNGTTNGKLTLTAIKAFTNAGLSSGGSSAPIATSSVAGLVKPGSDFAVANDGTLSINATTTHALSAGSGIVGTDEIDVYNVSSGNSVKYTMTQLAAYVATIVGSSGGSGNTTPASNGTAHRYWRINISNNVYGGYASLAEVSMATTAGGANVLTGGTATATSTATTGYEAIKALDGNPATWWSGAQPLPAQWQYDFGATPAQAIAELKITARNDGQDGINCAPSAFTLEWSDDGGAWTVRQSYTATGWTSGGTKTFAVPATDVVVNTPATTFTVTTSSSTGVVGGSFSVTVTPGTGGFPANTVVTPTVSGVAGSMVPATITASGTAAVTAYFTPSAAGTATVNATAPGMTSTGSKTVTVAAAQSGGGTGPSMTFTSPAAYSASGTGRFGGKALTGGAGTVAITVPPGTDANQGNVFLGLWIKMPAGSTVTGTPVFAKINSNNGCEIGFGAGYDGNYFSDAQATIKGGSGIQLTDGAWHYLSYTLNSNYNYAYPDARCDAVSQFNSSFGPYFATGSATLTIDFTGLPAGTLISEIEVRGDLPSITAVPTTAPIRGSATLALLHLTADGSGS